MNLIDDIVVISADLAKLRRDIHAHPELCFEENRTAALVAERLAGWGIELHTGIGGTGVVGVIRNGKGRKSIGLRADMDALPVEEANTFAHRSTHPGKMHACGHDGHTAMLLGAAEYLAKHKPFNGTIHLIFQPAEEGGAGAPRMMREGLFERFPCDAVFALHNWPGLPAGTFATRPDAIMASCNEFRITVHGKGAHAAMPHLGADPVYAAVQIYQALQSIITRNKRPIDAGVLSVTQFHAGETTNVIADTAWLAGTLRAFSDSQVDAFEARMREIVSGTAQAFGCRAELDFVRQTPATVNDPDQAALAASVMREIVGDDKVSLDADPTMGAEDFAYMLQAVPGCYAFIGNGEGDHRLPGHGEGPCMLHNASYDFNDALLPLGATYFVRLAEAFLK